MTRCSGSNRRLQQPSAEFEFVNHHARITHCGKRLEPDVAGRLSPGSTPQS